MGHITAELTKGWMMEGIGMQVILRILLSLALAAIIVDRAFERLTRWISRHRHAQ